MNKAVIALSLFALVAWGCVESDASQATHAAVATEAACTSVSTDTTTGFTMYEPTEMALLMRGLFDSLDVYKTQLEAGHHPKPNFMSVLENIHGAELTKPEIRGPQLTSFTTYFLTQAKALAEADSAHTTHYTNLINACIDCHKPFCPGPIVRIKKLELGE